MPSASLLATPVLPLTTCLVGITILFDPPRSALYVTRFGSHGIALPPVVLIHTIGAPQPLHFEIFIFVFLSIAIRDYTGHKFLQPLFSVRWPNILRPLIYISHNNQSHNSSDSQSLQGFLACYPRNTGRTAIQHIYCRRLGL